MNMQKILEMVKKFIHNLTHNTSLIVVIGSLITIVTVSIVSNLFLKMNEDEINRLQHTKMVTMWNFIDDSLDNLKDASTVDVKQIEDDIRFIINQNRITPNTIDTSVPETSMILEKLTSEIDRGDDANKFYIFGAKKNCIILGTDNFIPKETEPISHAIKYMYSSNTTDIVIKPDKTSKSGYVILNKLDIQRLYKEDPSLDILKSMYLLKSEYIHPYEINNVTDNSDILMVTIKISLYDYFQKQHKPFYRDMEKSFDVVSDQMFRNMFLLQMIVIFVGVIGMIVALVSTSERNKQIKHRV